MNLVAGLVDVSSAGRPTAPSCPPGSRVIEQPLAVAERDHVAVLLDRLPAESGQAGQQRTDAVRSVVRAEAADRRGGRRTSRARYRSATGRGACSPPPDRRPAAPCPRSGMSLLVGGADMGGSVPAAGGGRDRCQPRPGGRSSASGPSACQTAIAARTAVSARKTRGPRPTGRTNGSCRSRSSSASAKPPSGPVSRAAGRPASARAASATGAASHRFGAHRENPVGRPVRQHRLQPRRRVDRRDVEPLALARRPPGRWRRGGRS